MSFKVLNIDKNPSLAIALLTFSTVFNSPTNFLAALTWAKILSWIALFNTASSEYIFWADFCKKSIFFWTFNLSLWTFSINFWEPNSLAVTDWIERAIPKVWLLTLLSSLCWERFLNLPSFCLLAMFNCSRRISFSLDISSATWPSNTTLCWARRFNASSVLTWASYISFCLLVLLISSWLAI